MTRYSERDRGRLVRRLGNRAAYPFRLGIEHDTIQAAFQDREQSSQASRDARCVARQFGLRGTLSKRGCGLSVRGCEHCWSRGEIGGGLGIPAGPDASDRSALRAPDRPIAVDPERLRRLANGLRQQRFGAC